MKPSLPIYPQFLSDALNRDTRMRAAVDSSLNLAADILQESRLPFFSDYTDHGVRHLTTVLEIAEKLIADRSKEVFTPEDAAVLIHSVLLHDLALHLSEAGFRSLLIPKEQMGHHDSSWAHKWDRFLKTAKHWDDHRLIEIFGADAEGAPRSLVKNPFDHYDDLAESDRKLIGEFIRQNHAQMAHDFAIQGFPGPDGYSIEVCHLNQPLQALTGIVACSHGVSLRDSIRRLEGEQFNTLEHNNVHAVFLMGVLRVADFLDLGPDRAPVIAFRFKEIKSPVSRQQYMDNQGFGKISWGNPDPESLHIPASPGDVQTFLEIQGWMAEIQAEIDQTWAVLGEVYGAHPRFSKLGLAIRRVRSNILDDPEAYAKRISFVPKRVELGTADPDFLKLLVEPLYGRRPEFGIRELIQNAVDAVWERWEYERSHPGKRIVEENVDDCDVLVWLDNPDDSGTALLTVSDNGIGMTDETITNFFLKAGASLRNSLSWKEEFETERSADNSPRIMSRVPRSGHFGIGVFAAFLLGDEIEVCTRHITSKRGLRFSIRLDDSANRTIQLHHAPNVPVGTTITVKATKLDRYSNTMPGADFFTETYIWDWYCFDRPKVVRLIGKERRELRQAVHCPAEGSALPRGWHVVPSSEFQAVHMNTRRQRYSDMCELICNGIKVGEPHFAGLTWHEDENTYWRDTTFPMHDCFQVRFPLLSIFDPDGRLPLNLRRTGLTHLKGEFLTEIFAVQSKAILAGILAKLPDKLGVNPGFESFLDRKFEDDKHQLCPLYFTNRGAGLLTAANLMSASIRKCLAVSMQIFRRRDLANYADRYDALIVWDPERWRSNNDPFKVLNKWIQDARVLWRGAGESEVARSLQLEKETVFGNVNGCKTAGCPPSLLSSTEILALEEELKSHSTDDPLTKNFIVAEIYLKQELPSRDQRGLSIGEHWQKIIREPLIPYEPTERKAKLSHAFNALRQYLEDFQEIR